MTQPENFLRRWSNRKLGKEDPAPPAQEPERPDAGEEDSAKAEAPVSTEEQPFDVASLPSLESIGPDTDVRAFLKPGVPPELTREALRRAWFADPGIRDFVEPLENGWDFNDPDSIGGFGTISPGDVPRLIAQAVGNPERNPADPSAEAASVAATKADDPSPQPLEPETGGAHAQEAQNSADSVQRSDDGAAQS